MPLLALFDVDGTLFLTHDPLSSEALVGTLGELYAVDPPDDAVERVDHAGQTAKRIARLVLRAEGLDDAAIDRRLDDWCETFGARYVELLAAADTSGWQVAPGAADALVRLQDAGVRLVLLTGNPQQMARARMRRLGLERFFAEGQGGFGCDAEERGELIAAARERAGGWPAARTVEIGDTPRDVETARAAGVRSIAVGSPPDLAEVADLLLAWNG
jgi:phosphoglycolate phosphatase-like HAD superfamily hydrolase